jgi:tRNA pseudouridine13 synthase
MLTLALNLNLSYSILFSSGRQSILIIKKEVTMYPVLKYRNDDFHVCEVSLFPNDLSQSTQGKAHTIVIAKKEGYTTFEAIQKLASFFQLESRDIHCQGLKDEDGITEQILSIKGILPLDTISSFNKLHTELPKGSIQIVPKGFSALPVKEKSLHGNLFNLTVRNLDEDAADRLIEFCDTVSDFICINYYDEQRFGLPGGPYIAHHIGKAIINEDWSTADKLYRESGNVELDHPDKAAPDDELLIKTIDPRKINFFIAAYSSYLWNKKLSDSTGNVPDMEIFAGMMVSPLLDREEPIIPILTSEGYKLSDDMKISQKDKERATLISTTVFANGKQKDLYFNKKWSLGLQFFLPTGSYATMLVKQLLFINRIKK